MAGQSPDLQLIVVIPGHYLIFPVDFAGPVPLERQCQPEEVAAAVIFLLESDAFTGQTLFVDGGQHLIL